MDMMSILWQMGIFAAVLVFGVKIGLASGLANLSKKLFAAICIGYGVGILIISAISSMYTQQITEIVYGYNTMLYLIMATVMIIAGLLTIREWKIHDKNTTTATCLAVVAPCPCCFGSIVVSILMVAPAVGVGISNLSVYVAIILVAVMVISYFASNLVIKLTSRPYPVILGNFMLLLGAYFLLSSLVIPNIASVFNGNNLYPISIDSPQNLIIVIIFVVIMIIIGAILDNRHESILK